MSRRARIADILAELSDEASEFYNTPIKVSFGDLSGNPNLFKHSFRDFLKESRRLFIDYLTLSIDDSSCNMTAYASDVLGMVNTVVSKIRAYENARDCYLLHREYFSGPNRGNRVLHKSPLELFIDLDEDGHFFNE